MRFLYFAAASSEDADDPVQMQSLPGCSHTLTIDVDDDAGKKFRPHVSLDMSAGGFCAYAIVPISYVLIVMVFVFSSGASLSPYRQVGEATFQYPPFNYL